jgi:hypothetical protein
MVALQEIEHGGEVPGEAGCGFGLCAAQPDVTADRVGPACAA